MSDSVDCVKGKVVYIYNGAAVTYNFIRTASFSCGTRGSLNEYHLIVPGLSGLDIYFRLPNYSGFPYGDSAHISNTVVEYQAYRSGSALVSIKDSSSELPATVTGTKWYRSFASEDTSKGTVNYLGSHSGVYYNGEYVSNSGGSNAWGKATPKENYRFDGWYVDGTKVTSTTGQLRVNGNQIDVDMAYPHDVDAEARFLLNPTLTYDSDGGSPSPSAQTAFGDITLASAPTKSGYVFGGWSIGGTTYAAGATYTLEADATATAIWIGNKSITASVVLPQGAPEQTSPLVATITPAAIGGAWQEGTSVTVSVPATGVGVVFGSWDGPASGTETGNTFSFTMPDAAVTITANYILAPIDITDHAIDAASAVAVAESAAITVEKLDGSAAEDLVYGDVVRFIAPEPLTGYTFSGWYSGNDLVESDGRVCQIELKEDVHLRARYATSVTVTKDTSDGLGTFSVNGTSYADQTQVTLTRELGSSLLLAAIPDNGYYFGGWKIDDAEDASDLFVSDTATVDDAHTYTAVFVSTKVQVEVTTSSEANSQSDTGTIGTLTVLGATGSNGVYTVDGFTEITLVATKSSATDAEPLFRIVEVDGQDQVIEIIAVGDGSSVKSVTVRVSNTDRAFKAVWGSPQNFTVSVSSEDPSKGSAYVGGDAGATSIEAPQDSSVSVTAMPLNGYRFKEWQKYENSEWSKVEGAPARYTIAMLTEPWTLRAVFEADAVAICAWEGSSENKTMEWTSKTYVMSRPFDPVAARVDAAGYPVDLTVRTYSSPDKVAPLPVRDHPLTAQDTLAIQSQDGRRLPRMRPERYVRLTVRSANEVDAVTIGTNMAEVN